MSSSMQQISVVPVTRALSALKGIVIKGQAHAAAKGTDEANYLTMRLIPDMLPFVSQIRIACDIAKRGCANLAGIEPPVHADDETSFDQLIARIDAVIAWLGTITPDQINGSEDKDILLKTPMGDFPFKGRDYAFGFILANVHFHATMAYALLRGAGVELGKRDYLGA
jgi:uncharacterized protein